eukprot:4526998-Lingulodinium_polyedra.AAC.1
MKRRRATATCNDNTQHQRLTTTYNSNNMQQPHATTPCNDKHARKRSSMPGWRRRRGRRRR